MSVFDQTILKFNKTIDELPKPNKLLLFVTDDNRRFLGTAEIHKYTERGMRGMMYKELRFHTLPVDHRGKTIIQIHYPETVIIWAYLDELPLVEKYSLEERKEITERAKTI